MGRGRDVDTDRDQPDTAGAVAAAGADRGLERADARRRRGLRRIVTGEHDVLDLLAASRPALRRPHRQRAAVDHGHERPGGRGIIGSVGAVEPHRPCEGRGPGAEAPAGRAGHGDRWALLGDAEDHWQPRGRGRNRPRCTEEAARAACHSPGRRRAAAQRVERRAAQLAQIGEAAAMAQPGLARAVLSNGPGAVRSPNTDGQGRAPQAARCRRRRSRSRRRRSGGSRAETASRCRSAAR